MEFNPFSDEFFNDPYEIYRHLRDEAPVYHNEEWGFYALSRFDDVVDAHIDHKTFSSARGILIQDMDPAYLEARPMMIMMDPPRQTRLRKLISKRFLPRQIEAMEPELRELAVRILEPLVERGSFDYVKDYAAVFPMELISTMLGVPDQDRVTLRELVDVSLTREAGNPDIPAESIRAMAEMDAYLKALLAERRRRPQEDLISALLVAEVEREDGTRDRLTDPEILGFAGLVAGGGNETVTKLLGNAIVLFWRHPDVQKLLVESPARIPDAIEEALRYWPPSQIQGRSATREVQLHGTTIPEGSRVLLLTGAACRDEREFPNPDRFDIDREIPLQLALGHGAHKCLGGAFARLEARISFEEFFKRISSYEVHEERCTRVHMSNVAGYSSVPISF